MFTNPEITRQLAGQHHRAMLTDAQNHRLARHLDTDTDTGAGTAPGHQPLTYRLWRRLRPVTRPRLEPQV